MIEDYLKEINFSKRNIVTVSMVLISVVAMYNWFVQPHTSYLMAAEKYEATAAKIDRAKQLITNEIRLKQKKLDKLDEQFEANRQEFFTVEKATAFLADIQSKAEDNGCFVEAIRFLPAQDIAADSNTVEIKEYPVELSIAGQYQNIVMAMNVLQKRQQKVWVNNIELKLQNMTTGYLSCDVELSINTLKIKENTNNVNVEK